MTESGNESLSPNLVTKRLNASAEFAVLRGFSLVYALHNGGHEKNPNLAYPSPILGVRERGSNLPVRVPSANPVRNFSTV